MSYPWQSFLPWHVLQTLSEHSQVRLGAPQRFEAVALFADVSGFTAISEALGASGGRNGAEELTDILNRYFTPMIALIHRRAGVVAKFGGDAMTVLFPALPQDGAQGLRPAARRALQCAREMQARMPEYASIVTSAGAFGLAMKAGLAAGTAVCTLVGDTVHRLETVIAGGLLDRAADAEHHAAPGEVVAHAEVLALAGEAPPGDQLPPWFRLNLAGQPIPPVFLPPPGALSRIPGQVAWAFVHPSIAERIRNAQESFINEHRRVTVIFMSFSGFEYDTDPQVTSRLQDYLSRVFTCAAAYGGYVNKVDMGDKGSKVILLFGAPIAQEDDLQAALCCALDLAALPGASARLGVNTGFVFCGQVGSLERREYTVMGDAVNLAARLMQRASPGEVLVGEATYRAAPGRFRWGLAAHMSVKGKHQPVTAYPLLAEEAGGSLGLQEPRYALPMVGRQTELALARGCIERALAGQGQILGITAEAGMGKSRLAAEVIGLAYHAGMAAFGGECLSHGAHTAYLVWRAILRGVFHLEVSHPIEAQIAQIHTALQAISPDLLPRLPLLGLPLNLPIPENDTTRSLEGRMRKESLEDLVITCLRAAAVRKPLFILLEDCHWLDPLSQDLLDAVGRELATQAALILVVYRPLEAFTAAPAIRHMAHFTEIALSELTLPETEQLIRQKLGAFGVSAHGLADLSDRINTLAQGNPFFVDELMNWLHDRGLTTADVNYLQTLPLPESLHSLIISRIDRLEEAAKTTLKVASILGRSFRASWLWGIFPAVGAPEQVRQQLAQLSRLDITPLDRLDPELEYLFKHMVTREVAYESLALSTRQMLHEQAGAFIEATYPDSLDAFIDLLAYHYGQSAHTAKQAEYFHKAAHAARRAYANSVAVGYFERLLPLLCGVGQARVRLSLGQVLLISGEWARVEQETMLALQTAQQAGDDPLTIECLAALGALERHRGNYAQALKWLGQARRRLRHAADARSLGSVLREEGIVQWSQGEYGAALRCFRRGLRLAKQHDDTAGMVRALGNISLVHIAQGDGTRGLRYARRGLKLAEAAQDRLEVSTFLGNLGTIYHEQGDYLRALDHFTRYLHLSVELGFRMGIAIAIGNIGNVYLDSGYSDPARVCFSISLKMSHDLGDQLGVAIALWSLALADLAQGLLASAENLLSPAIRLAQGLDVPYELSDFLAAQVTLLVRQERWSDAESANQLALEAARSAARPSLEFSAQRMAIWLHVKQGKQSAAEALPALEALRGQALEDADQADWRYTFWQISGDEVQKNLAAEAYTRLYLNFPHHQYRQRCEELTGRTRLVLPALPTLPDFILRARVGLAQVLAQLETP